jgi:hypothetical protein
MARGQHLHNEVQASQMAGIDFVASFTDVGGGHGGCNSGREFFGCRLST